MSIAEKLEIIAKNQRNVYDKGGLNASPQETVSGKAIVITDISPIEHNMTVKVTKKNIIQLPYYDKTGTESKGVVYTINDDGTVTANGTATSNSQYYFTVWSSLGLLDDWFEDGETYVMSGNTGDAQVILQCKTLSDNKDVYFYGNGKPFTIDKNAYKYCFLRIQVDSGKTVDNITVKPMIEKGTVATEYVPYLAEDISTVKLYNCGKNLLNEKTVSPIVINADGWTRYGWEFYNLPKGTYTLSVFGNYDNTRSVSFKTITNGIYSTYDSLNVPYNPSKKIVLDGTQSFIVYLYDGVTNLYDNVTLMLEWGTQATEYEPYTDLTVHDVQADGTVEGVKSICPSTTLYTDTSGAVIDCTYYQDGKKVKENLMKEVLYEV